MVLIVVPSCQGHGDEKTHLYICGLPTFCTSAPGHFIGHSQSAPFRCTIRQCRDFQSYFVVNVNGVSDITSSNDCGVSNIDDICNKAMLSMTMLICATRRSPVKAKSPMNVSSTTTLSTVTATPPEAVSSTVTLSTTMTTSPEKISSLKTSPEPRTPASCQCYLWKRYNSFIYMWSDFLQPP